MYNCVKCVSGAVYVCVTLVVQNLSIFVGRMFLFSYFLTEFVVEVQLIFFFSDFRPSPTNRWFQQGANPHNKAQDWLYLKGYWDRKYTQLPDIY